ncbi:hypothetical protein CN602_23365 [Bacillus cereus]|uniref:hypothetical protein n=1 Tax=Bacillus cereus TaxID=1396 RepID=UPI000BEF5269|nr:hypothetical protein [Bacillus cereus]PEL97814.1 hypothetical protein CN602_23365 [Bacillus cereus]
MIRHITTKNLFEKMKKTGYIIPAGNGVSVAPEKEYVAFEQYKGNKSFYKAIYEGKKSNPYYVEYKNLKLEDLVGLMVEEKELENEGIEIVYATSEYPEQYTKEIDGRKFTTKWENYIASLGGILSNEDYENIGEYVFVKGSIPIKYVKQVENLSEVDISNFLK